MAQNRLDGVYYAPQRQHPPKNLELTFLRKPKKGDTWVNENSNVYSIRNIDESYSEFEYHIKIPSGIESGETRYFVSRIKRRILPETPIDPALALSLDTSISDDNMGPVNSDELEAVGLVIEDNDESPSEEDLELIFSSDEGPMIGRKTKRKKTSKRPRRKYTKKSKPKLKKKSKSKPKKKSKSKPKKKSKSKKRNLTNKLSENN